MKRITTTLLAMLLAMVLKAQSYSETINKEITFKNNSPANVLHVANLNGGIKVEAYAGDKVLMQIKKKVNAKTQQQLEESKEKLRIGVMEDLDTVIVFIEGPCESSKKQQDRRGAGGEWFYNQCNCDYEYQFTFDFSIKVPKDLNLYVSTINHGDISVSGVSGSLHVRNINGSITMSGVAGQADVHTVNGDVTLDYAALPNATSSYYTLNGDINALFPKGLKADMTFKSYNGDFYTNIDQLEYKSAVVEKRSNEGSGIGFKLDSRSAMSVGGGGVLLDFETFNGDVFVKEKQ